MDLLGDLGNSESFTNVRAIHLHVIVDLKCLLSDIHLGQSPLDQVELMDGRGVSMGSGTKESRLGISTPLSQPNMFASPETEHSCRRSS